MPNLIGKTLGKVRVDMFLAKGGMAEVYIGNHTTLHRSVAVKFLKADLQDEPDLRDRFEREARVIAMLRHPNIIQIFDFDSYLNQPYLVMEYVPGTSLGAYLRELHKTDQRLDMTIINKLLGKVAGALAYAHDNTVIHRDVKPANILLTSHTTPVSTESSLPHDVEPILTDFGLVRFTQSNTQTNTGYITGTPAYMSPEQARGDKVDTRTDVYSLGITVYEMLAGRVPFDSDTTLSVLHQHIYDPPPPIEGISTELQLVIDRALEKDPDKRFQTSLEFAEAFNFAILGTSEAETLLFPSSALARSTTVSRRNTQPVGKKPNKRGKASPFIIGGISIAFALVAYLVSLISSQSRPVLSETIQTPTHEHDGTINTPSDSQSIPITPDTETVGVFRFQDGSAKADQVTFSSTNLPPPPDGSQYEAWLLEDDNEHRISMGVIQFDSNNIASLTFVSDNGRNLVTQYHGVEITIEPTPDNSPNPSNNIAFSAALPSGGYTHVRHLLSAFSSTPDKTPFVRGLIIDADLLNDLSGGMLASFEAGDKPGVRLQAEQMLNLIVGTQSSDYRDWNEDGNSDDPSDGYGLLLNGDNGGYIQGTFSHANLSLSSPDATVNMTTHGEHVMASATNLSEWTPQLRDHLIAILEAPSLPDAERAIRQAVVLANQIRSGVDVNGDEVIEPIPGEGGAITAYEHSYYMADILIMP